MQRYPLVTVVGGSGFVGRHTVKLLAAAGYRVRVLVRDTVAAEYLRTCATVGEIAIERADITRPETLTGKLVGSDAVVSLVSIMHESGRQKFDAINVAGAAAVAAEAKRAGVKTLVHISALGIEQATDTKYGQTKLAGEQAVRAAFPEAVILRPSLIVGPEDRFFQRFARMALVLPFLPMIGGGHTKFQPVLVTDVAAAILAAITRPECAGKTYALAGSHTYTMRAMLEQMARITNRHPRLITLPFWLANIKAFFWDKLPIAMPFTRDQVKLLTHDNVVTKEALTFANLGLAPLSVEDALPQLLARYVKA